MSSKAADWRFQAWRLLAVWILALIAYSNSFQGGFVFDNATAILRDPRVHALTQDNIHLIFNEEYWYNSSTTGLYRPLTTFSYLLNYALLGNGANPAGYHWFNFLVHSANIALVYFLGLALLEDWMAALALAALWGVHPLLTESVSNIAGRADLLAAFGVLAGLLCHRAAASAGGRRKLAWLGGLAAAAAIAIFSKEAGAVLPGVMLLYDATWHSASWRRRIAGYAVLAVPFAAYFSLRADLHARIPSGLVPYADNPLFAADFWTARLTAVKIIGKYIGLFFWPAQQSADYSYNAVPLGPSWIALAVCLGVVLLLAFGYRAARPLFFFLAFSFLTLAPTANLLLLIGSIMAERFVYLPCIGLAGCVVWGIRALSRKFGQPVWTGAGVVCLALAACTWARNPVWRDDLSLWTSVAAACPDDFKAHTTLSEMYANGGAGQLDRAVAESDRALQILSPLPDNHSTPRPYATAGMCYRLKGDSVGADAAAAWYGKARDVLLHGETVDAGERAEIVRLNQAQGRSVSAAGWMPLYLELGRVYLRLKDPQKAREFLTYGRSHSGDPEFAVELSRSWRAEGNEERAAMALIEPVLAGDTSQRLAAELVSLYKESAPGSCAVREAGGTASIDMQCPLVRSHLCAAAQELAGFPGQAAKAQALLTSLGCSR